MSGAHRDQDRMLERWKVTALAEFQFLLEVTGKIVMPRKLNGRAERRIGLHENFAGRFTAARAPGHLREQLERPFAGAEIRHVEGEIGVDDPDKGDVWKMQTLRD